MASPRRIISALGAFFVLASLLAACGGVPGNSVARVDNTSIKKSTFDHWIGVAALSSQTPGSTSGVTVPDAPAERFPAVVALADVLLETLREPEAAAA